MDQQCQGKNHERMSHLTNKLYTNKHRYSLSSPDVKNPSDNILQKIQKYLRRINNLSITNKLSLQLEALSNCDNFTVITVLYNNDVLTWDYKDNNKYQVTMS